ncbi:MAG: DinB family protein [Pyrinomonadaceae bacterium]
MSSPTPETSNLITRLAQTPERISDSTSQLSPEAVRSKPSAEEFSVLEHVCHLRDLEIEAYGYRIDRMLEAENPSLPDFDGAGTAIARVYNSQDFASALAGFTRARMQNVQTLSRLNDSQLDRAGDLPPIGRITIKNLMQMMHDHDEDHLHEMQITIGRFHRHAQD